jgi:hypothetical protein
MDRERALKKLYTTYNDSKTFHRSEILYIILQIKKEDDNFKSYKQSLYLDIKKFIKFYIKSTDKKDYGYDKLNVEKIIKAIETSSSEKEKYELSLYASRLINLNGLEAELIEFTKYLNISKTKSLKKDTSLSSKIRLISHVASYKLSSIVSILIVVFFLSYLIFLPSKVELFQIFRMDYSNYADGFYLNHFLNLFSLAIGIESKNIIIPLNGFGVFVLAILKLAYILIILNFLYQKTLNIIYAN